MEYSTTTCIFVSFKVVKIHSSQGNLTSMLTFWVSFVVQYMYGILGMYNKSKNL